MSTIRIETNDTAGIISAIEDLTGGQFFSCELFKSQPNGHIFSPGDKCKLTGLESFPQFNGEVVMIMSIREDDVYGRAYYFHTDNDALEGRKFKND